LSRERQKSWKETLDHYVEVNFDRETSANVQDAIKKLKDNKAVDLQIVEDDDDEDMDGNDSGSQSDQARPKPLPILQLTQYVQVTASR
jgi:hypothetical protein